MFKFNCLRSTVGVSVCLVALLLPGTSQSSGTNSQQKAHTVGACYAQSSAGAAIPVEDVPQDSTPVADVEISEAQWENRNNTSDQNNPIPPTDVNGNPTTDVNGYFLNP